MNNKLSFLFPVEPRINTTIPIQRRAPQIARAVPDSPLKGEDVIRTDTGQEPDQRQSWRGRETLPLEEAHTETLKEVLTAPW